MHDCNLLLSATDRLLLLAGEHLDKFYEPTNSRKIAVHFLLGIVTRKLWIIDLHCAGQRADHLVFVSNRIDQLGFSGCLRRENANVDECPHTFVRQLAIGSNALHQLFVQVANKAFVLRP